MPDLYIITGSNGAGKSSVGPTYLPSAIVSTYPVFDGDKLFMEKRKELWHSGIRAHKESRNLAAEFVQETFDRLVEKALAATDHFVYEGHFTNDATWDIPKRFRENGYTVHLYFLGLNSPELSDLRVLDRSTLGGHYVDPLTVRDNFYGNLEKLNTYFPLIDHLKIFDTSDVNHILLTDIQSQQVIYALPADRLPQWFVQYLPVISALINRQ